MRIALSVPGKTILLLAVLAFFSSCSRTSELTPEMLQAAEQKWMSLRPAAYRAIVVMKGDRVEPGRFEVLARGREVTSLRRNGEVILPNRGQDYSMEGLFLTLHQELELAAKPSLLGAPAGYSAYPMARFDPDNGRLIQFQRSVGGTQNSIEIDVVEFDSQK